MRSALLLLSVSCAVALDEPPRLEGGIDVARAIAAAGNALSPAGSGSWQDDLGALTDPDPGVHQRAVAGLVRRGPAVLGDVAQLARDADWQIRARCCLVAAGIGGAEATPLLLTLSQDRVRRVRELAALGLGRGAGDAAVERLLAMAAQDDGPVRAAAAEGLGALGDVRAIPLLAGAAAETDDLARRAKVDALRRVALQPRAVPELVRLLSEAPIVDRPALIDAAGGVGDPRLCPPLAALLADRDPVTVRLAAQALATVGDARAVEPLCRVAAAASDAGAATAAVATLARLTGYRAAPGQAWAIWWRNEQAALTRLAERDAFLAAMHDPAAVPTRSDLARFTPAELAGLIDSVLPPRAGDARAPWWPARAWALLSADDPARWTAPLLERVASADGEQRTVAIILLDQLGAPASALNEAARTLDRLAAAPKPPRLGSERLALGLARERRR